jgi:death-on-curing protein
MVKTLSLDDVIALHDYQIKKYKGDPGIRDRSLLESAVNHPLFIRQYFGLDLCRMAAGYCYHISQNHAFIDGNKRTGAAAMITFLRLNCIKLIAAEEEILDIILDIANRRKTEEDLVYWLAMKTRPL